MAIYAVSTDLMRDTIIFGVRIFSQPAEELNPSHPFWFCAVYWAIFIACIFATLYIAVLDIRYTRMQFAMEKRTLVKQSWEAEDFRKILKTTQQRDDKPNP
jgi:hypothetical protein